MDYWICFDLYWPSNILHWDLCKGLHRWSSTWFLITNESL
jgi:hypothetical protein